MATPIVPQFGIPLLDDEAVVLVPEAGGLDVEVVPPAPPLFEQPMMC